MRKLPEFFNLLASKKLRNIDLHREIFRIIGDEIFLHGIELGSYEAILFSLKTLNIILKQYCGDINRRFNKSTNIEENINFKKFLEDNEIWNLTSPTILNHLIKFVGENENSDVGELAVNIIVEFFIQKSVVKDIKQLEEKIKSTLNTDPTKARKVQRFFILKFELSICNCSAKDEMIYLFDVLKTRFLKIEEDKNPIKLMEEGLHLFSIIECVNLGLRRMDPSEVKNSFMSPLIDLLKSIVSHFLDFINDPSEAMSFEVVDQKLTKLTDNNELKTKLLLFIFYTLRASSEVSEALVVAANSTAESPIDSQVIKACIDINVQILTRSCHKGAIEKACETLGKITKMVSRDFSKLLTGNSKREKCYGEILETLKKEIDFSKRLISDSRSSRGLILMAHQIIINHPPFLKFFMDTIISETNSIPFELIRFKDDLEPIQLHLLAMLIRDSVLVEEMLKYLHSILLGTLKAYRESNDFVVLNALLQIIGAIVPKISNQKRQNIDNNDGVAAKYEPKSVTVQEFYVRFPGVFWIGITDLQNKRRLPKTYIIILLEIFSNFEQRDEFCRDIEQMRIIFQELMEDRCEKIRTLAGRCYTQYMQINGDMLKIIEEKISSLFSSDPNMIHSTVNLLRHLIQRYESCSRFVNDFDFLAFKSTLRDKISTEFKKQKLIGADNFFIRYHLMDFLIFIDFQKDHEVVESLMQEMYLKNQFGYKLWAEKLKKM